MCFLKPQDLAVRVSFLRRRASLLSLGILRRCLRSWGFEHSQRVDGFSSRAFPVVEVSELASDVFGVDGV